MSEPFVADCELVLNGRRDVSIWAHDLLSVGGRSVAAVPFRERLEELRSLTERLCIRSAAGGSIDHDLKVSIRAKAWHELAGVRAMLDDPANGPSDGIILQRGDGAYETGTAHDVFKFKEDITVDFRVAPGPNGSQKLMLADGEAEDAVLLNPDSAWLNAVVEARGCARGWTVTHVRPDKPRPNARAVYYDSLGAIADAIRLEEIGVAPRKKRRRLASVVVVPGRGSG